MAVKVEELLQLQSLQNFKLISGAKGLDRIVCSAGIMDYEFVPEVEYHNDTAFEKESFVISSLLFAKNEPEQIIDAIKALHDFGASAFAFKTIIFNELPAEVIEFSNEKGFPIFTFGPELYFENIIYEIMEAVQREDTEILTEENIKKMIEHQLRREEISLISKGVSLMFKQYAMAVYISPEKEKPALDSSRLYRSFYLNKNLKHKSILARYHKGMFIVITGAFTEEAKFEVILQEVLDNLSIRNEDVCLSRSNIHHPHEELDRCFRESYYTHIASTVENKQYHRYDEIGSLKYLIPLKDDFSVGEYTENLLKPILDKEEFFNTLTQLVMNHGDIVMTASDCNCHQNTIRYRLTKIKELIGASEQTEFEFYSELATAIRIHLLKKQVDL
ncbi:hypothetical protein M2140_000208 [Clostridiales Family XIII bacterium PM5-7]